MIAQPSSRFREPTIDLVKNNFGDRVEIRDGLSGTASVISTEKAQRLLDWNPRHDWLMSSLLAVRFSPRSERQFCHGKAWWWTSGSLQAMTPGNGTPRWRRWRRRAPGA